MSDTQTAASATSTTKPTPQGEPIVKPAQVATSQGEPIVKPSGEPIVKP